MKVQLPWLNKATGRSAGTIYQSYWGATYTRSMPALFHYPDTEKQQHTQAIFFDLQRIWLPIYNVLSHSISKQQRKNKNPFNMLSSFIYKIFHPYSISDKEKYPSNFGLDRLNRVRPTINAVLMKIDEKYVSVDFFMDRLYNGTQFHFKTSNMLLFNITRKSMLFFADEFSGGPKRYELDNTNGWEEGDEVVFYIALSCESWLGNFNKVAQW